MDEDDELNGGGIPGAVCGVEGRHVQRAQGVARLPPRPSHKSGSEGLSRWPPVDSDDEESFF